MQYKSTRIIIVTAALLGILVVGFFFSRLQQVPARAAADVTMPATIKISANLGETFAPAPASAAPTLTARQAWLRYAKHVGSGLSSVPRGVTARLGLFTLPVGPADEPRTSHLAKSNGKAYIALNKLAYGYSWHSCPVYVGDPGMRPPPHTPCRAWLFLDANTGKMIIETWQA